MKLTSCIVTSSSLVTIYQPFGTTGFFTKDGTAFTFTLNPGGINPTSAKDAGPFIVSTYYTPTAGGTNYPIDTTTFTS